MFTPKCADLLVKVTKQAIATFCWHEKNNESLPKEGDQYIITGWNVNAKVLIDTTKVIPTPYNEIARDLSLSRKDVTDH